MQYARLSAPVADRFRTTSCWRRNAVSASRAACDLNSPTSNPLSSFRGQASQSEDSLSRHLRHPGYDFSVATGASERFALIYQTVAQRTLPGSYLCPLRTSTRAFNVSYTGLEP